MAKLARNEHLLAKHRCGRTVRGVTFTNKPIHSLSRNEAALVPDEVIRAVANSEALLHFSGDSVEGDSVDRSWKKSTTKKREKVFSK